MERSQVKRDDATDEQTRLPRVLRAMADELPDTFFNQRGLMKMAADRLATLEARLSETGMPTDFDIAVADAAADISTMMPSGMQHGTGTYEKWVIGAIQRAFERHANARRSATRENLSFEDRLARDATRDSEHFAQERDHDKNYQTADEWFDAHGHEFLSARELARDAWDAARATPSAIRAPKYWHVGWAQIEQRASGAIVIGSVSDEKTEHHNQAVYIEVTIGDITVRPMDRTSANG